MVKKLTNEIDEQELMIFVESLIYRVRGLQVLLDKDLAVLYGVETRVLNQTVKRNIDRFPEDFMFQLTFKDMLEIKAQEEKAKSQSVDNKMFIRLKSQIVISNNQLSKNQPIKNSRGGERYYPYVFTENGIAMLSGILNTPRAVEMNIAIMRAFVWMRKFFVDNGSILQTATENKLENIEANQIAMQVHLSLHDKQFDTLFKRLEERESAPTQGIYYDGQIFDAYKFVCDKVQEAQREVVLIDNYIDTSILSILDKRAPGVAATVYTQNKFASIQQDVAKHNAQYPAIMLKQTNNVHDRFLIIDETVYHIGASIKDLGKKLFAFSKLTDITPAEILSKLK